MTSLLAYFGDKVIA